MNCLGPTLARFFEGNCRCGSARATATVGDIEPPEPFPPPVNDGIARSYRADSARAVYDGFDVQAPQQRTVFGRSATSDRRLRRAGAGWLVHAQLTDGPRPAKSLRRAGQPCVVISGLAGKGVADPRMRQGEKAARVERLKRTRSAIFRFDDVAECCKEFRIDSIGL